MIIIDVYLQILSEIFVERCFSMTDGGNIQHHSDSDMFHVEMYMNQ